MLPKYQTDAGNNTAAISFTLPGGASDAVGDTVVLVQVNDWYTVANILTPTGTAVGGGWTLQHTFDGGTNSNHIKVWTGVITNATGTILVNNSTTDEERYGGVFVFPGSSVITSVQSSKITSSTSYIAPAATAAIGDECLICFFGTDGSGSVNFTMPGGNMTAMAEIDISTLTTYRSGYESITASGTTGTRTATSSVARTGVALSVTVRCAAYVATTSPAIVSVSTASVTATTASFNPPAGVLIACGWTGDNGSAENNTMAITNNGTALTWTLIGRRREASDVSPQAGWVEAWCAVLPAGRTGMTVTGTLNVSYRWCFKVYSIGGSVDSTSPISTAYVEGSSTAVSFTTTSITSVTANSIGFCVANDWNIASGSTTTQPTSSDLTTTTGHISTSVAGLSGYKGLGASGSVVTAAISTTGSGPAWNYLWFEIEAMVAAVAAAAYVPRLQRPHFKR